MLQLQSTFASALVDSEMLCVSDALATYMCGDGARIFNVSWTFLGGFWKDNTVDFDSLSGYVVALEPDDASDLNDVVTAFLSTSSIARCTQLVTGDKTARGRGNAPKVSGTLLIGGSTYSLTRTFSRRSDKVSWTQASVQLALTSEDSVAEQPATCGTVAVTAKLASFAASSPLAPSDTSKASLCPPKLVGPLLGRPYHRCAGRPPFPRRYPRSLTPTCARRLTQPSFPGPLLRRTST